MTAGREVYANTSRQVAWWEVHEFVQPHIEAAGPFPVVGTVAWQLLSATEPGKWAALLDAAQHYALRLDIEQEAAIEAGQAISRSQDWGSVASKMRQGHEFYAARPWLRRKEVA
ncbi:DUF2742 domain-containing protein [Mycobacteroides abscessus]|uniref:DUF2742 domain-containing protein n=1 Tax=Mycobacteroides abscessus TaxID=36809 RepID=UPI000927D7C0|nr:DUF2742 domain-containing protein [Mycobacteroides abscessus]SHU31130.1 phiRv2 prophage protein [Mycobacteroides abscessus subsp. abscessus]SHU52040.1 phiRv2 prophage protein [Mycobacteroides abscessus subsp. abscessus]SIG31230.1 phiRv2 prophage protein [Mycobacteroides abscessus subsp. abscessus]SII66072.1 phiRv2 prophage protein [Mycobacteroides abscessus subsp. abscessus]SKP08398.1 phiRv2 prophage protein [Mycobacteroides abscessus subsp. abscessus]